MWACPLFEELLSTPGALAGISSNPKFQSILQKHIEAYKAANSEE